MGTFSEEGEEEEVLKAIRGPLASYLEGKRPVAVRIRQVKGSTVTGFVKMEEKGELHLVDFEATMSPKHELLSLKVGGRRFIGSRTRETKRARRGEVRLLGMPDLARWR